MRLNKFVPLMLALLIHLLPVSYFLIHKTPETSSEGPSGSQGIDLTGFSTTSKKHAGKASSAPAVNSPAKDNGPSESGTGSSEGASTGSSTAGQPGTGSTGGSQTQTSSLILSAVEPVYPPLARQKGLEGLVKLKAHYDQEGLVTQVEILNSSGVKMLDESAKKALMGWKLKAGSAGSFEKTFQFKLNN